MIDERSSFGQKICELTMHGKLKLSEPMSGKSANNVGKPLVFFRITISSFGFSLTSTAIKLSLLTLIMTR